VSATAPIGTARPEANGGSGVPWSTPTQGAIRPPDNGSRGSAPLELKGAEVDLGKSDPEPVVDHRPARERALRAYATLRKRRAGCISLTALRISLSLWLQLTLGDEMDDDTPVVEPMTETTTTAEAPPPAAKPAVKKKKKAAKKAAKAPPKKAKKGKKAAKKSAAKKSAKRP